MMDLFDPLSAVIVLGGTLLATVLRCGWKDTRSAVRAIGHLFVAPFDSAGVRAELAVQIQEIGEDGLMRAEPHHFGDGEFDELSETLVRHRSIHALHEEHERHRYRRAVQAGTAGRVLMEAAELGPVLGLAGTLLALSGLADGTGDADFGAAIGSAVLTTLYGLVAGNFLFAPLSCAVERRARAEERERQELLDWLAGAIARAESRQAAVPSSKVAA